MLEIEERLKIKGLLKIEEQLKIKGHYCRAKTIEERYECSSKKARPSDNTVFTHRAIRPSVRQGDFGEVAAAGQPCTG
ncbi:hypothetical protein HUB94_11285 [Paenibacillus cellulosilyticus]|uniref:hypothetical protein n=1 Tax=Paenibacillus cellulosilyticus TaxID=375489 RepID=UPI001580995C|nr:hypothetical protein [Paenibacillus cellulosilyticus]QKS44927.1 hypothetical protein HUB94_11285 [Paenibacillus cellulosilyticus]